MTPAERDIFRQEVKAFLIENPDMATKIDSFAGAAQVQQDHSLPVLSLCKIKKAKG